MFLRKLNGTEYLYSYSNSNDINTRTGFIGHLRCDFGKSGTEFWTTMFPYIQNYPDKFSESLQYVVDCLRGKEKGFDKKNQILKDRRAMEKFCYNRKATEEYLLPESTEKYGARVDCDDFSFIINFYPRSGDYNAYIYCYITKYIDEHLKNSEKGIRFTDSKYNELFTINDGERILITEPNGEFHSETCRFIDDYQFETYHGAIFHIHQFAELMENAGNTVKPIGEVF